MSTRRWQGRRPIWPPHHLLHARPGQMYVHTYQRTRRGNYDCEGGKVFPVMLLCWLVSWLKWRMMIAVSNICYIDLFVKICSCLDGRKEGLTVGLSGQSYFLRPGCYYFIRMSLSDGGHKMWVRGQPNKNERERKAKVTYGRRRRRSFMSRPINTQLINGQYWRGGWERFPPSSRHISIDFP